MLNRYGRYFSDVKRFGYHDLNRTAFFWYIEALTRDYPHLKEDPVYRKVFDIICEGHQLEESIKASKSWFGFDKQVRHSVDSEEYLKQLENRLLSIPLRFVDRSLTEAEYKGIEQETHPQIKTARFFLRQLKEMHKKIENQKKHLGSRVRHFFSHLS